MPPDTALEEIAAALRNDLGIANLTLDDPSRIS
jgi:hypothetical protein